MAHGFFSQNARNSCQKNGVEQKICFCAVMSNRLSRSIRAQNVVKSLSNPRVQKMWVKVRSTCSVCIIARSLIFVVQFSVGARLGRAHKAAKFHPGTNPLTRARPSHAPTEKSPHSNDKFRFMHILQVLARGDFVTVSNNFLGIFLTCRGASLAPASYQNAHCKYLQRAFGFCSGHKLLIVIVHVIAHVVVAHTAGIIAASALNESGAAVGVPAHGGAGAFGDKAQRNQYAAAIHHRRGFEL